MRLCQRASATVASLIAPSFASYSYSYSILILEFGSWVYMPASWHPAPPAGLRLCPSVRSACAPGPAPHPHHRCSGPLLWSVAATRSLTVFLLSPALSSSICLLNHTMPGLRGDCGSSAIRGLARVASQPSHGTPFTQFTLGSILSCNVVYS